ncbi:MAG TPA: dehydrogenase, partial [Verrucomicrobiota bacterium]|nr:dehydrogenase [Verrucomicrobiota bacterium]
ARTCASICCGSVPGTPPERRQRVDCAVWRYHPVRHDFEVFAEGTSNPWGIDFDEHGQLFLEACVVPHFWHVIQGARYQRQGGQHFSISLEEQDRVQPFLPRGAARYLNPFIYADIQTHGDHVHWAGSRGPHAGNARSDAAGGGHAHAGLMVYLGGSWPARYHNQIFIGNIHGQRFNVDIPVRRGSGYVGVHAPDFLNFNDTWSQSLNQRHDQDGSMYVIDWYDKNQCHHNREDGHDRGNGRIYKVVYGQTPVTRVNPAAKSDAELIGLLTHSNHWHSRTAIRLLQERAAAGRADLSLVPRLKEAVLAGPAPDRLRALWALHALAPADEAPTLLALLRDPEEYLRAWAVQLLAEGRNPSPAALAEFTRLAREDDSQLVRLYLAAAMQRTPVEQRAPVLAALMGHAEDAADHNLPLMYWYALEPVVGADPELALRWITETKVPLLRQFITRRLVAGSPAVAAR